MSFARIATSACTSAATPPLPPTRILHLPDDEIMQLASLWPAVAQVPPVPRHPLEFQAVQCAVAPLGHGLVQEAGAVLEASPGFGPSRHIGKVGCDDEELKRSPMASSSWRRLISDSLLRVPLLTGLLIPLRELTSRQVSSGRPLLLLAEVRNFLGLPRAWLVPHFGGAAIAISCSNNVHNIKNAKVRAASQGVELTRLKVNCRGATACVELRGT